MLVVPLAAILRHGQRDAFGRQLVGDEAFLVGLLTLAA